jgi:hypothetical protein
MATRDEVHRLYEIAKAVDTPPELSATLWDIAHEIELDTAGVEVRKLSRLKEALDGEFDRIVGYLLPGDKEADEEAGEVLRFLHSFRRLAKHTDETVRDFIEAPAEETNLEHNLRLRAEAE